LSYVPLEKDTVFSTKQTRARYVAKLAIRHSDRVFNARPLESFSALYHPMPNPLTGLRA